MSKGSIPKCRAVDFWNKQKRFVDPRGDSRVDLQTTLTMLWRNSLSITRQTHEKLTSICFFKITNCQIVRTRSLPHRINYKIMCLSAHWRWKLANERARICVVIVKTDFENENRQKLKTKQKRTVKTQNRLRDQSESRSDQIRKKAVQNVNNLS